MDIKEKLVSKGLLDSSWAELPAFDAVDNILRLTLVENVYPSADKIFRAFNECPLDKLQVVILGQDPYHDGSATGLAFDNYIQQKKTSPSLQNILKELKKDTDYAWDGQESALGHLPEQGVLLLNTALTVEKGKAGSHTTHWKPFTEQLIKDLQAKDNLVWILWGNHAKSYKKFITNKTQHILEGGHPSPLNTKGDFENGNYFSKANSLISNPINW